MLLKLKRIIFLPDRTIGNLYIKRGEIDILECYTLEDTVRPLGVKIPGQTAIPAMTYKVVLDYSNRFKKIMPHILDVPMFEGVRIHAGNTAEDTEGCILVGDAIADGKIKPGTSRSAYERLLNKLQTAVSNKEEVKIEIEAQVCSS